MARQWGKHPSSKNQATHSETKVRRRLGTLERGLRGRRSSPEERRRVIIRKLGVDRNLAQSGGLYLAAAALCVIPLLTALSTSLYIPQSIQLTVTCWFIAEQWIWLSESLRGQGHKSTAKRALNRAGTALCLWTLIPCVETSGHVIQLGSRLLFSLAWLELLWRVQIKKSVCGLSSQQARVTNERLIGSLSVFTSLATLLLWRIHALEGEVALTSTLLLQAPLLLISSTYWLRFVDRSNQWNSFRILSYIKRCGVAFFLPIATICARHTDSLFRNASLVFCVAITIFYFASYLLPERHFWRFHTRRISSPLRSLSFSFLSLCALGTGLLLLPMVTLDGRGFTFMEAIFTSVSASCITGLSIIDLSKVSLFGQMSVLFLIQIGGFGIVLLSHMLMSTTRDRLSGSPHTIGSRQVKAQLGESVLSTSHNAARLMSYVVVVEAFSALVLTFCFLGEGLPVQEALWRGIFTSISAFCNAGFALSSDSFMSMSSSTLTLNVISMTVILGGLGPTVVFELIDRSKIRGKKPQLSYFSRLVLIGTSALFILPTFAFCLLEWDHAFAQLQPLDKVTHAFFHSTSLRTAGFNSFDLATLSDGSWSISLLLMLIGGSPLSTAGGIKVTTIMIAFTSLIAVLRGRSRSAFLNRSHSLALSAKALATVVLSLLIVFAVILLMQLSGEPLTIKSLIFEVISALGTVGLSMGGTATLSAWGLSLIMLCMFLGRVGPPALLLSITEQAKSPTDDTYLDEDVPLA